MTKDNARNINRDVLERLRLTWCKVDPRLMAMLVAPGEITGKEWSPADCQRLVNTICRAYNTPEAV